MFKSDKPSKSFLLQKKIRSKFGEEFDLTEFHNQVKRTYKRSETLQKTAKDLSISVSQFQRDFKAIHGDNYSSFMKKYVLSKSKRYLQETDYTIIRIAMELGYNNPSKFSKAFFEEYGLSPSECRKRFRKASGGETKIE